MTRLSAACLRRLVLLSFVFGGVVLGFTQLPVVAADQPPSSSDRSLLKIVAVDIQPANPGPDTLCKFRVRMLNAGKESASDLSFQVSVNGQRLANYINHTFRSTLEAGKATDLSLFNFWSSETGRLYPSDGRLVIEVRLVGARWLATDAQALAGPVQPLPLPFSVTLTKRSER